MRILIWLAYRIHNLLPIMCKVCYLPMQDDVQCDRLLCSHCGRWIGQEIMWRDAKYGNHMMDLKGRIFGI